MIYGFVVADILLTLTVIVRLFHNELWLILIWLKFYHFLFPRAAETECMTVGSCSIFPYRWIHFIKKNYLHSLIQYGERCTQFLLFNTFLAVLSFWTSWFDLNPVGEPLNLEHKVVYSVTLKRVMFVTVFINPLHKNSENLYMLWYRRTTRLLY